MIVAGEVSGDGHAAKVVRRIREMRPDITFFGATGPALRAEGVETVVDAEEFAIVGILEIAKVLPMFVSAFRKLRRAAKERRPDAVVLVDFPEFNLKLARALKKQGNKVIYYISPQVWAWRKYRARTFRRDVDLLLAILPFEKDWYAKKGISNVEYVGSPLVNEVVPTLSKREFADRHEIDAEAKVIALLPGSRGTEITRILPVMLDSAAILAKRLPNVHFVVALSGERDPKHALAILKEPRELPPNLTVVRGETFDALHAADAAAVCSGTATLEAGIIGTPMAIVYKGSELNYRILRPLISVEHFGLINLIAGERVAAELIQHGLSPRSLADELFRIIQPDENERIRGKLAAAAEKLGESGTSQRVAEAIIREVND